MILDKVEELRLLQSGFGNGAGISNQVNMVFSIHTCANIGQFSKQMVN